jgi:BirA family biotin operon repressor/biotin-[acetyl-CoA-carboxylase] ligase
MDTRTLERALGAAGLQAAVRWQEVTGSTNEVAAAMAAEGAPEWSIAAAGHQTAGRGRLGRTWDDRPGRSLMCSLVLRPVFLDPDHGGWIPLLAGVSLAEACREVTGLDVRCKWPNDLLVGAGKVAGVLVESQVADGKIAVAVVGTGLNLEAPDIQGAAGIGADADPEAILTAYLREMAGCYRAAGGIAEGVRDRWLAMSATIGREVLAATVDGRDVRGIATGLDDRGGLIVETPDGPTSVGSGEVAHLG